MSRRHRRCRGPSQTKGGEGSSPPLQQRRQTCVSRVPAEGRVYILTLPHRRSGGRAKVYLLPDPRFSFFLLRRAGRPTPSRLPRPDSLATDAALTQPRGEGWRSRMYSKMPRCRDARDGNDGGWVDHYTGCWRKRVEEGRMLGGKWPDRNGRLAKRDEKRPTAGALRDSSGEERLPLNFSPSSVCFVFTTHISPRPPYPKVLFINMDRSPSNPPSQSNAFHQKKTLHCTLVHPTRPPTSSSHTLLTIANPHVQHRGAEPVLFWLACRPQRSSQRPEIIIAVLPNLTLSSASRHALRRARLRTYLLYRSFGIRIRINEVRACCWTCVACTSQHGHEHDLG